ncbi:MAG: translesion error-prone DNA polymerase V autoproteolytic subunit [Lentisphaerae bacterium]|jgi:DNA polymerase V|nr:translesion error-prone DNA polymerase V autoproteolytic subunit [Lentisphaerota bacterium]
MKTSKGGGSHGGARAGAGRKPGSGRFGEPTVAVRVPESRLPLVASWLGKVAAEVRSGRVRPFTRSPTPLTLPLVGTRIAAGFPSPADDHLEGPMDLNEHLVAHPAATFVVRVEGDSMIGAGIRHGDLLVVDRALEARSGSIVVAVVDGELTVKRLRMYRGRVRLEAENPAYPPIEMRGQVDLIIWGVVAHAIRSY